MTRGYFPCETPNPNAKGLLARWGAGVLIFCLVAMSLPLLADATSPAPAAGEDFGQYLADHEAVLGPFFAKNSGDLFRLGVPVLLGATGWIILVTMLVGWVIDVLMSRGFSFFFAPAFPELKRSVVYATGRLFLSFVYTCLLGVAIVFSLKLPHPGIIMAVVVTLLLIVALAAQIVWILYLYRTDFFISGAFYLAIIVVHSVVGVLIAKPIMGLQASSVATDFVDRAITPRLQAEAETTKRQLGTAESAYTVVTTKIVDLQHQIAQAQTEEAELQKDIEAKKNSDIYVFGRIVQARARGELGSARDQLTDFLAKFPSSSLDASARAQLAQVNSQLALEQTQKTQEEADAARAAAQAQADLLARAGKGEVTLSEMRQALIGKSRAQVSSLLGLPSETASDSWGYRQRMILNPLTNEKFGLMIYFTEGTVQSVDYNRNGGPQ